MLYITGITDSESDVGGIVGSISASTMRRFDAASYGSNLKEIVITIVCRDPSRSFKRPDRFSKADKTLYMDVVINFGLSCELTRQELVNLILGQIVTNLSATLRKYRLKDFAEMTFTKDLREWFTELGFTGSWIPKTDDGEDQV